MANRKNYPDVEMSRRLRELYLKSGLTQKEITRKVGVERKSVINWIHGVSCPAAAALAELCRLFRVTSDYILFGKGE